MLDIEKLATFLVNLMKNAMSPIVASVKALEDRLTNSLSAQDLAMKVFKEQHERMIQDIGRFEGFDPKEVWSGEQIQKLLEEMIEHQSTKFMKEAPPPVEQTAVFNSLQGLLKEEFDLFCADIRKQVKDHLDSLPPAEPGRSIDPEQVASQIKGLVDQGLAPVRSMIEKDVAAAVAELPPAKDGVSLAGAMIDREGGLVVTLSDGTMRTLGKVVGEDVDMESVFENINSHFEGLPKPKDGNDGFGFDDLSVQHDGKRTFTLVFEKGDRKKEFAFKIPSMINQGVYKGDASYDHGDCVTWAGSSWHCEKDGTTTRPGEDNKDWVLIVKRGRNGDVVVKTPADPKKTVKRED